MEIRPYQPDLAGAIADAYNGHMVGMPHCYRAAVESVAAGLAPVPPISGSEAEPIGRLQQEALWVALQGGRAVGWGHAGTGRVRRSDETVGVIRFLWYARGERAIGQALLDRLEQHLIATGVSRLVAFHHDWRYPFYHIDHAYLSDRMGHVHALLGWNGYARSVGEVYLDWPDVKPPSVAPAPLRADIVVDRQDMPGRRPDIYVYAHLEGQQIGMCHCVSEAAFAVDDAAADSWSFCHRLRIDDAFQGGGLGRQLLLEAIRASVEVGYRHASISTALLNYRAALFYANIGYHVADWTYGLAKDLKQGMP